MKPDRLLRFERLTQEGEHFAIDRAVAIECPVALEFNGVGYAVLMASPTDLEDLAVGFALSERLIETVDDVIAIDAHDTGKGMLLRVQLTPGKQGTLENRVRHRITESSCGLCGIENLEQALRPLPLVTAISDADEAAIFRALDALYAAQPGNRATGAMHAAACYDPHGTALLVREDVGRHNAFDKLIGAMAREGRGWGGGFALLTSRCSYELVEKAVLSDCPLLVTLSAPTSLAMERAAEAGLALIVLARPDSALRPLASQNASWNRADAAS